MPKDPAGKRVNTMVSFVSLQAFFGLAVLVVVGSYLAYRRTDLGSALIAVIGAGILGLYLTVGIIISLVDVP